VGETRCQNATTLERCNGTAWVAESCTVLPDGGADSSGECQANACVHPCDPALAPRSSVGCEFWGVNLDNPVSSPVRGLTTSGQGSNPSEFGFILANQSTLAGTVNVTRVVNNATMTVATVALPSNTDATTRGVVTVRVPWQALGTGTNSGVSGLQRYGYRITTTRPVTVAQFNPLASSVSLGSCTTATNCTLADNPVCNAGTCQYFAFTNDSSLLQPVQALGRSYVVLSAEHTARRTSTVSGAPSSLSSGHFAVVATQAATTVTVTPTAATSDGGVIGTLAPGVARQFTLQPYDVLQLTSELPANVVNGSTAGNLECGDDPFSDPASCSLFGTCNKVCRLTSGDLTGSTITADKPIAVFAGSNCAQRGYLNTACDHLEEQLTPPSTWGRTFVAPRSAPLRLTNNTFASTANAGPDYYKLVAACPDTQCPQGTQVTLSTAPSPLDVLTSAPGNGCDPGTSLAANNCVLRAGKSVEFLSKASFSIAATQPLFVGQFFAGQDATTGTTRTVQGDPSFISLPAVEQWRASTSVVSPPGFRDSYLSLSIDDTVVESVRVDGVLVTSFVTMAGASYKVATVPVGPGLHRVEATPRTGVSSRAGVGVTVYAFDQYVSYGYAGPTDLAVLTPALGP
jgi:hypothetical protein